ncbi:MAG: ParB N-terminal domain-containing protein, partial [Thermus sp.]|uniref:ParB N-terminal domain-containing protein n=1 Tax=Thermus sp. TaxID=275 RepID=UPI00391DDD58
MSRLDEVLGTALLKGKEAREKTRLPLRQLIPRPQPRRRFEGASLEALAESVRAHGVLEPLLVRKAGEGYEIIAGERRYRA